LKDVSSSSMLWTQWLDSKASRWRNQNHKEQLRVSSKLWTIPYRIDKSRCSTK